MTRIWLKPWAAALGLALAAALVVLNFSAVAFGAEMPWLSALDLVADLTVLGAMIVVIVQTAFAGVHDDGRNRCSSQFVSRPSQLSGAPS